MSFCSFFKCCKREPKASANTSAPAAQVDPAVRVEVAPAQPHHKYTSTEVDLRGALRTPM